MQIQQSIERFFVLDEIHCDVTQGEEVVPSVPSILTLPPFRCDPSIVSPPLPEAWYCYILRNRHPRYAHLTYNGSTNDLRRRLRQHNEEISGGAKYTHGRGGGWEYYAIVTGFPDHKNALSCEWRIKHTNGKPGKRPSQHCGVAGRIVALNDILRLDKWTQPCIHANRDHRFTLYLADDVVRHVNLSALLPNVVFGGNIDRII
jgi:predicted GIY-YIG superfamily endonuclease